ncbi:hypothetical protein GFL72_28660 [Rhizobium leguminosarum bv. viciae]|uniref:hypothetical protein n=1 Tax=Rhizobium leguminosarum TaxID=384 RepID=UPI00197F7F38|nr:hypothetical protein [Rhizobium leguminosarum]NKK38554.1 hypothetical protein [Rhizobium leguminosarum bv. viciae]
MDMNPADRDEDLETALAAVRRRIATLKARGREIEEQIASAEQIARMIESQIARPDKQPAEDIAQPLPSPVSLYKGKEALTNGELVIKLARQILHASKRPLSRQELLEKIVEMGHTLTVTNPAKFINRTLWAHPDFTHVPGKGYWFAAEEQSFDGIEVELMPETK